MADRLTLTKALATGRLEKFIEQEEKRGIGPANRSDIEAALRALATPSKPLRSKDRTSRSASRDGLRGK